MTRLACLVLGAVFMVLPLCVQAQDTITFTDDTGRIVEIPADPQRIVSLHDNAFSVQLLELGVIPAGSHGRVDGMGNRYIRGARALTGVDFDNSPISFVGAFPVDIEALIAARPDLIIAAVWQETPVEQLEKVAPTIVLDPDLRGVDGLYEVLAEITGTTDRLALLQNRYELEIAQIRRLIDTESLSAVYLHAFDGQIGYWQSYGGLGRVLSDSGFRTLPLVAKMEPGSRVTTSPEILPELDADIIFVSYRNDAGETPEDAYGHLEDALPGFCNFLHACRENQIIYVPRDEVYSSSFFARAMISMAILTNISGRNFQVAKTK